MSDHDHTEAMKAAHVQVARMISGPWAGQTHEILGKYIVGPVAMFSTPMGHTWQSRPIGRYDLVYLQNGQDAVPELVYAWIDFTRP